MQAADVLEAAAIQAGNEFEQRQLSPHMCLFVPGSRTVAEFMSDNYSAVRAQSNSRGLVHRVKNRISQHLCAPILNPDMRLGCIAPLNHDTRHLPPEMRDFVLRMTDVNFDFLQTTEPVTMNEIVLSEFNGGVQDIATSESLLYLPNFMEYQTQVSADLTFSKDCYSGTGVPAFLCIFCRSGSVIGFQPLITTLSLQNRTTMKKSDTVFETDIHELFHMTQRNVHNRSEYEHTAFNKRQTILLASEDVGIMGMDPRQLPAAEAGRDSRERHVYPHGHGHRVVHIQQPRALPDGRPAVGRSPLNWVSFFKNDGEAAGGRCVGRADCVAARDARCY